MLRQDTNGAISGNDLFGANDSNGASFTLSDATYMPTDQGNDNSILNANLFSSEFSIETVDMMANCP